MTNLERLMRDLQTTIGEKQKKARKQRVSTRALGTNPRTKDTNPRAKRGSINESH